jgi:hypothetical protein
MIGTMVGRNEGSQMPRHQNTNRVTKSLTAPRREPTGETVGLVDG